MPYQLFHQILTVQKERILIELLDTSNSTLYLS